MITFWVKELRKNILLNVNNKFVLLTINQLLFLSLVLIGH